MNQIYPEIKKKRSRTYLNQPSMSLSLSWLCLVVAAGMSNQEMIPYTNSPGITTRESRGIGICNTSSYISCIYPSSSLRKKGCMYLLCSFSFIRWGDLTCYSTVASL
nr:hypothetical protein Q903MT_gene1612 [Picea sitchensis]